MPRILFVATLFSPLAARWIKQLENTEWDVHVFGEQHITHDFLRGKNITVHSSAVAYLPFRRILGGIRRRLPRRIVKLFRLDSERTLTSLIHKLRPDCIHSLKMQNETYLTYDALHRLPPDQRPPWIYSTWGSDIFLYQHDQRHLELIKKVLTKIDYLIADNPRDISLALKYGFKGRVLGVYPSGSGYPIAEMQEMITSKPSQRRIIAIKGYQTKNAGQVLMALKAIKGCGKRFDGYRIVIHSAIDTYASRHINTVKRAAKETSLACDVPIDFLPYSPPEAIWRLFGQSRIAIAISKSDGTPNAMLEAIIMGAFPIQSDTGGLESWISSGENGFLVPFDDVVKITEAILTALEDDTLVDRAAIHNYATAMERINGDSVRTDVIEVYRQLLGERTA